MLDSLLVLQPQFYKAKNKNSFNKFGKITYSVFIDGTVTYLRLANRVQGLVFSKTVNKRSLMIKERLEKD